MSKKMFYIVLLLLIVIGIGICIFAKPMAKFYFIYIGIIIWYFICRDVFIKKPSSSINLNLEKSFDKISRNYPEISTNEKNEYETLANCCLSKENANKIKKEEYFDKILRNYPKISTNEKNGYETLANCCLNKENANKIKTELLAELKDFSKVEDPFYLNSLQYVLTFLKSSEILVFISIDDNYYFDETKEDECLKNHPQDISINKNSFLKNSSEARLFIEKFFPNAISLYNDFITYITSKFKDSYMLNLDIIEYAGFYDDLNDFTSDLLNEFEAIKNNNPQYKTSIIP